MNVLVAENCGFCPGVRNAISIAEEVLNKEKCVYSLGPIIHNKNEVERLAKAGLKTVSNVEQIGSGVDIEKFSPVVLVRSHGASPEELAKLKEKGLTIVDATCVLVKRVQAIAQELEQQGYKVVIIGDANHPEIQAVMGCVREPIVVSERGDLDKLPENGKLGIVCQTTQSVEHFAETLGAIATRGFAEMKVINTLCKEAIKRQKSAVELCKQVDIMFVLGSFESANTRKLAELCKKYNNQTFHLQNWSELDRMLLLSKKIAGVTAGASTPEWIIAEFVENLTNLQDNGGSG